MRSEAVGAFMYVIDKVQSTVQVQSYSYTERVPIL